MTLVSSYSRVTKQNARWILHILTTAADDLPFITQLQVDKDKLTFCGCEQGHGKVSFVLLSLLTPPILTDFFYAHFTNSTIRQTFLSSIPPAGRSHKSVFCCQHFRRSRNNKYCVSQSRANVNIFLIRQRKTLKSSTLFCFLYVLRFQQKVAIVVVKHLIKQDE